MLDREKCHTDGETDRDEWVGTEISHDATSRRWLMRKHSLPKSLRPQSPTPPPHADRLRSPDWSRYPTIRCGDANWIGECRIICQVAPDNLRGRHTVRDLLETFRHVPIAGQDPSPNVDNDVELRRDDSCR